MSSFIFMIFSVSISTADDYPAAQSPGLKSGDGRGGICSRRMEATGLQAGERHKYEPHGERDPFVPLIGIGKALSSSRLENVTSIADVKLEGIASSPRGNMIAILNGEMVKEGDKFGAVKIMKITKKDVAISIDGKKYEVGIIEEGGQ